MEAEEADAFVDAVAGDWRSAPLTAPDRALCEFAAKLTGRQHEMALDDLDRLRELGFDDRAIHDAVQVIGYFNYITRLADALGVEREDFIRPWGSGGPPRPSGATGPDQGSQRPT
jgi:uncharacterized peroxidase-related enzyme